jgi:hypothetical protein
MNRSVLSITQQSIAAYNLEAERWRSHDTAMACFEFEDLLQAGLRIFRDFESYRQRWQARIDAGQITYDEDEDAQILALLQLWLIPAHTMEDVLGRLEAKFGTISGADDFRTCVRRARQLLESGTIGEQLRVLTPNAETLRKLAKSSPPPQSWLAGTEERPF